MRNSRETLVPGRAVLGLGNALIHPVAAVTHPLSNDCLRDLDAINCSTAMEHNDAIRIYDYEHANPTMDGVPMLIRATQWMAKQYRRLADEGLTRNVADRFDDWKHTKVGMRIIGEVGIANAWEAFKAGGCWAPPKEQKEDE